MGQKHLPNRTVLSLEIVILPASPWPGGVSSGYFAIPYISDGRNPAIAAYGQVDFPNGRPVDLRAYPPEAAAYFRITLQIGTSPALVHFGWPRNTQL